MVGIYTHSHIVGLPSRIFSGVWNSLVGRTLCSSILMGILFKKSALLRIFQGAVLLCPNFRKKNILVDFKIIQNNVFRLKLNKISKSINITIYHSYRSFENSTYFTPHSLLTHHILFPLKFL